MENKKLAAGMAAVMTFIKTEEELITAQLLANQSNEKAGYRSPGSLSLENLWGISGRQSIMQNNTMIQVRLFK